MRRLWSKRVSKSRFCFVQVDLVLVGEISLVSFFDEGPDAGSADLEGWV